MNINEYLRTYGPEQVFAIYEHDSRFRKAVIAAAVAGSLGAGMFFHYIKNSPAFSRSEKDQIEASIVDMPRRPSELKHIIPNYEEKVKAVDNFLEWSASRMDIPYKNIYLSRRLSLNPEFIVQLCAYYNYDIKLLLAQLHVESHCGVTNAAYKHNNPFSHGLTDNGGVMDFDSQNDAIEPYILLVQTNYLMVGTDNEIAVIDLLDNYVNYYGARYASATGYEKDLKTVYFTYLSDEKYKSLSNGVWGDDSNNPHSKGYEGKRYTMVVPKRDATSGELFSPLRYKNMFNMKTYDPQRDRMRQNYVETEIKRKKS